MGPWDPDIFSYTAQVNTPWADGVAGVWYPAVNDLNVYAGMLPFLPVGAWQVTLTGGERGEERNFPHRVR